MHGKKGVKSVLVTVFFFFVAMLPCLGNSGGRDSQAKRLRARELGLIVGILPPGALNAITDVPGVKVGHLTKIRGQNIRTGITAILPHSGNLYQNKVPAAIFLGNAMGKLAGYTQVEEMGRIETPILLTSTLNVPRVSDGLVEYMLALPGNEQVRSVNPLVGETNDGWLNDIRSRPLTTRDVIQAIQNARSGPVQEGCVGAGTGTICFGFKGGIGTASRILPRGSGGFIVGVLVQTNFGGILRINGAPVGRELNRFYAPVSSGSTPDGSCMMVVATDAPMSARNLKRLAKRSLFGLARTGSVMSNGSGDYVIAFSTSTDAEYKIPNQAMTPFFLAVIEATEEAVYNSLFKANSMVGYAGHAVEAIPLDRVKAICKKYGVLHWDKTLPLTGISKSK